MIEYKDKKVLSSDGKFTGKTTGMTHRCKLEGCNGVRVTTKWEDGKTSFPCSKGLQSNSDGSLQIR